MTTQVTDAPDSSPRRPLMSRLFLSVVITAVLAGGGGLAAGRATAVESANEDCAATLTAEKKAEHEAYRLGHEEHRFGHDDGSDPDEWVLSVRTHAYLITQNRTVSLLKKVRNPRPRSMGTSTTKRADVDTGSDSRLRAGWRGGHWRRRKSAKPDEEHQRTSDIHS